MKLFVITLISIFSFSFTIKDISEDISNALKQGNAASLVKFFPEKISIKVLTQEDLLSKSQAQVLIEDFFAKHKVKSYKTGHTSVVNVEQQFITGSLDTNNGKFRISILVRGNLISQFRIENDNG
jgi:glycosylphosphatidylinositol transamidase (GPIT) subunit GPI8